MKRITIIGGGASGTLLAANILKLASGRSLEVNLVERGERLGRGVAYSTVADGHLLNVPANKMGAYPDDVEHFHRWLGVHGHDFRPDAFVPRRIYGDYLGDVLEDAVRTKGPQSFFRVIDDEAVDVLLSGTTARVSLRSGEILETDLVVLAFGNFLPPHPTVPDQSFIRAQTYLQNPWNGKFSNAIRTDDAVFIVGTGLTMVDVVLQLFNSGHRGPIRAVSTRGLLPAVHKLGFSYSSFYEEIKTMSRITDILKTVRAHVAAAETDGSDWRAVIDSLRPHAQNIWFNLPTPEKRYFLQHLSRYWNVARHRMPPQAADVLSSMTDAGQLEILKGRPTRIEAIAGDKFRVAFKSNGHNTVAAADVLINCIGAESNFARIDVPLVQNLLNRGYIRPDDVQLGLKAATDGNIINRENETSKHLWTLGTALKGTLWETTAIPEIRTQANKLALTLLSN